MLVFERVVRIAHTLTFLCFFAFVCLNVSIILLPKDNGAAIAISQNVKDLSILPFFLQISSHQKKFGIFKSNQTSDHGIPFGQLRSSFCPQFLLSSKNFVCCWGSSGFVRTHTSRGTKIFVETCHCTCLVIPPQVWTNIPPTLSLSECHPRPPTPGDQPANTPTHPPLTPLKNYPYRNSP